MRWWHSTSAMAVGSSARTAPSPETSTGTLPELAVIVSKLSLRVAAALLLLKASLRRDCTLASSVRTVATSSSRIPPHSSHDSTIAWKAVLRSPSHTLMNITTSAGPSPLPMSSVRVNSAKAVPRISGRHTFCSTARTLGPVAVANAPDATATAHGDQLSPWEGPPLSSSSIGPTPSSVDSPISRHCRRGSLLYRRCPSQPPHS
mmetsp:Transcript_27054/g.37290  ORF Transcript_27054/g.37290 Transcript_27054/m.37290 type:complete len:204 (-) Transcript_27054:767-1378(-)